MSVVSEAKKLVEEGWSIRVRKLRGKFYISARKSENGKRIEKGLGFVSANELAEIEELVKREPDVKVPRKPRKKPTSSKSEEPATINTTTPQPQPRASEQTQPPQTQGGVGGRLPRSGGNCLFMVHRLGLRFVKPWVSQLLLRQLGEVRFVERSRQWVVRVGVGVKRWLTVQVNSNGTAQLFLEASDNPLTVEEFVGFCRFYLLDVMYRITGKWVSLSDFEVMVAPELNCDLNGVVMEGVKSLTLQRYYEDVVRLYYSDPGVKETMPDGGTRVEVRAKSLTGLNLQDVVEGVVSVAKLPTVLTEIKKDLELIKGSLPRDRIEANQLSEAVAAKLANLIYLTFEKWGNRFELALRELGTRLQEALAPVFEKIERLERENAELRRRLEDSSVKFEELPDDLRGFLKELERDGYVRISETRIAYGDRVWAAIVRRKGNIDAWLNEESYNYYGKQDLFKAVVKAIRYYDNRYNGKPGVPYDLFLDALKKFLEGE